MKKKIVFFTLPAFGHTKEPAELIRELNKTYDILVVATEKFICFYEGVDFYIYKIPEIDFCFDKNPLKLTSQLLKLKKRILEDIDLKKIVQNADYVAYDTYAPWGKDLALFWNKECISYGITYTQNFLVFLPAHIHRVSLQYWFASFKFGKEIFLKDFKKASQIFKNILPSYTKRHIALIPEFLQPKLMKNKNFFYGSSLLNKHSLSNKNETYIYVSLGSIYINEDCLKNIILILNDLGFNACVSAGTFAQSLKKIAQNNVVVTNFSNQEEELQKATLFITHAGTNSVIESIKYKVPMICLPQAVDQFVFAKKVEDLSLGVYPTFLPSNLDTFKKLILSEVSKREIYEKNYIALYQKYPPTPVSRIVEYVKNSFLEERK